MIKKTPSINLFTGRNKSIVDRFLNWALGVGRLLIILTEVIALSAFLYRFSLDRQLIDLKGQIKGQETTLESLANNEKTYRNFQDRIFLVNQLNDTGKSTLDGFKKILQIAPSEMTVNTIALQKKSISIDATTHTISSLTKLIKNIKQIERVKSVFLEHLDNKISTATIGFTLNIVLSE